MTPVAGFKARCVVDVEAEGIYQIAALVADAAVVTANAVPVGTIETIDGDNIILAMTDGSVALMRENFAADAEGNLVVLFTQSQLLAALNGEGAPQAPAGEMTEADAE